MPSEKFWKSIWGSPQFFFFKKCSCLKFLTLEIFRFFYNFGNLFSYKMLCNNFCRFQYVFVHLMDTQGVKRSASVDSTPVGQMDLYFKKKDFYVHSETLLMPFIKIRNFGTRTLNHTLCIGARKILPTIKWVFQTRTSRYFKHFR